MINPIDVMYVVRETPALYLDPGSGSILIQLLLAALLATGVVLRVQWARIKKFLGLKGAETTDDDDDNDE